MERGFRGLVQFGGLLFTVLTIAFLLRLDWAIALWPFAMLETRLGFIFLASIAGAIAVPTLWIAFSNELRAVESGGIDLVVTFVGWAGFLVMHSRIDGRPEVTIGAAVSAGAAIFLLGISVTARRFAWRDTRPMPAPVRWSFFAFAVVLLLADGALVLAVPNVFPWPLAPESSVMYGWIFLGAMVYFSLGFVFPRWANAAGQLAGFLIYDLILIGPFVLHFATVRDEHRLSLIIYTSVLISSGVLASYYLFVNRETRLWNRTNSAGPVNSGLPRAA